ncbi:MAG: ATP-binding protein [Terriglobia bacterium]
MPSPSDAAPTSQPASRKPDTATLERFFPGASEMARRMRQFDWHGSVLGPVESWPESLLTSVRICLGSRHPIVIWWGKSDLVQFYNDAYISFMGTGKHPAFLGRSGRDCWSEIWGTIGPMLEQVFTTGEATWSEDLLLVLNRSLPREEAYFTFSYSPIWDDAGKVEGIFCACYETTGRVIGERRLRTLRDLGRALAGAKTPEEACEIAAKTLTTNKADIPFSLIYLLENGDRPARLAAASGLEAGSQAAPYEIEPSQVAHFTWPVAHVLESGVAETVSDLSARFSSLPGGLWPESPNSTVILPIAASGQSRPAGFLVAGVSPRRPMDGDYRSFFDLIAGRAATAISNAQAYDEERRRANALAEIDRAKTTFFTNISHEFRTPLTLLLSPLEEMLTRADGLESDDHARLVVAHRNGIRLLKLVNTLLDFSRIEAGRVQAAYHPTDLAKLTRELASSFSSVAARASLEFQIDCDALDAPLYVDYDMWEKIVLNLLSNAFKFTFNGGVYVSLRDAGASVELRVRDTGAGISETDLPRIFERFYRVENARGRSFEGSGIGLALVRELVKLHGGKIAVTSALGQGSTFTVSIPKGKAHLPADRIEIPRPVVFSSQAETYAGEALRWLPGAEAAAELLADFSPSGEFTAGRQSSSSTETDGDRATILLGDDNADMREYLARLLRNEYRVISVGNGQEAVNAALAEHPDLIVSDVMMPVLDGFGLLRALRDHPQTSTIPIILLSARAGEESSIEGLAAGADDYVTKPFSARELLARVRSQLQIARLRRENEERIRESNAQRVAELEKANLEVRASRRAALSVMEDLRAETEERKRTEETLRESAERFRAIFEQTTVGFAQIDRDGYFTLVNDRYCRLLGRSREELLKMRMQDITHPEDRDRSLEEFLFLVEGRGPNFTIEKRYVRPDGQTVWVRNQVSGVYDGSGNLTHLLKAVTDISDLKAAEVVLRRSMEFTEEEVNTRTRQLKERTEELEASNRKVVEKANALRELSVRLMQSQDEERRRIARDLHDSTGQELAALALIVSGIEQEAKNGDPGVSAAVAEARSLIKQLTQEIRTTSYLLHPPLLDETGLPTALRLYITGLAERSGLSVDLSVAEDFGRLPESTELALFRIVQESLTNIHRHSGSKRAWIRLSRNGAHALVEIEDEGKGIPAGKLEAQGRRCGVGIAGMQERVRHFGGELIIQANGKGTKIAVSVPAAEKAVAAPHAGAPV